MGLAQREVPSIPPAPGPPASRTRRAFVIALLALGLLAVVRAITGANELTSSGSFGAALRLAVPILLAGLGAVYAERAGVINIGLEGMMILGTWFGAWAGFEFGPWQGVLFGIFGGALGGLLHAVATVTFGIDHIVSGVAINILAAGAARFLSVVAFTGRGGGATQSPRVTGGAGRITLPFLGGGELFGWQTPDLFGALERQRWVFVSDIAAIVKGVSTGVSWLTILAIVLVILSFFLLWRTSFGLRLRSVGEHPVAAESLGVPVYRMKYIAVIISGGMAGLGGAYLVLEQARIYREGQTGGRGFIGLAAMIFGNWRPGGVASAAGIFGYADSLHLRSERAAHGLLLFVAIALSAWAVWRIAGAGRGFGLPSVNRRGVLTSVAVVALAGLIFYWFASTDTVPREFVFFLPHITTLLVLSLASQRLRPPAADGVPYRRGQSL
jgi:general nucleoside transport system permease protein